MPKIEYTPEIKKRLKERLKEAQEKVYHRVCSDPNCPHSIEEDRALTLAIGAYEHVVGAGEAARQMRLNRSKWRKE
jgi:hypothetical protein